MDELLKFPDKRLLQISGFVREFDEELFGLLKRMKDVCLLNDLKGLAAIELGVPKKVILFKKGEEFIELINPTIYFHEGFVTISESDETIPGAVFEIRRYEKIKVMYYDKNNNQRFLEANGEDSYWLQRKIDLTFGGLLFNRLPKKEAAKFLKNYRSETSCPTYFVKDRILTAAKIGILLQTVLFIAKLLGAKTSSLVELSAVLNAILLIAYLIYSNYETKKYKNCTSCQAANALGTFALFGITVLVIFVLNIFI